MVLPGLGSIDEEGSGGRPGIEDIEIKVKSTTMSVPTVALVIHRRGPEEEDQTGIGSPQAVLYEATISHTGAVNTPTTTATDTAPTFAEQAVTNRSTDQYKRNCTVTSQRMTENITDLNESGGDAKDEVVILQVGEDRVSLKETVGLHVKLPRDGEENELVPGPKPDKANDDLKPDQRLCVKVIRRNSRSDVELVGHGVWLELNMKSTRSVNNQQEEVIFKAESKLPGSNKHLQVQSYCMCESKDTAYLNAGSSLPTEPTLPVGWKTYFGSEIMRHKQILKRKPEIFTRAFSTSPEVSTSGVNMEIMLTTAMLKMDSPKTQRNWACILRRAEVCHQAGGKSAEIEDLIDQIVVIDAVPVIALNTGRPGSQHEEQESTAHPDAGGGERINHKLGGTEPPQPRHCCIHVRGALHGEVEDKGCEYMEERRDAREGQRQQVDQRHNLAHAVLQGLVHPQDQELYLCQGAGQVLSPQEQLHGQHDLNGHQQQQGSPGWQGDAAPDVKQCPQEHQPLVSREEDQAQDLVTDQGQSALVVPLLRLAGWDKTWELETRVTLGSRVQMKQITLVCFQRQNPFGIQGIHVKDITNLEQQNDYDEGLTHDKDDAHLKKILNYVSPSSTCYTLSSHDSRDRNEASNAASLPVGWKSTKIPDGWKLTSVSWIESSMDTTRFVTQCKVDKFVTGPRRYANTRVTADIVDSDAPHEDLARFMKHSVPREEKLKMAATRSGLVGGWADDLPEGWLEFSTVQEALSAAEDADTESDDNLPKGWMKFCTAHEAISEVEDAGSENYDGHSGNQHVPSLAWCKENERSIHVESLVRTVCSEIQFSRSSYTSREFFLKRIRILLNHNLCSHIHLQKLGTVSLYLQLGSDRADSDHKPVQDLWVRDTSGSKVAVLPEQGHEEEHTKRVLQQRAHVICQEAATVDDENLPLGWKEAATVDDENLPLGWKEAATVADAKPPRVRISKAAAEDTNHPTGCLTQGVLGYEGQEMTARDSPVTTEVNRTNKLVISSPANLMVKSELVEKVDRHIVEHLGMLKHKEEARVVSINHSALVQVEVKSGDLGITVEPALIQEPNTEEEVRNLEVTERGPTLEDEESQAVEAVVSLSPQRMRKVSQHSQHGAPVDRRGEEGQEAWHQVGQVDLKVQILIKFEFKDTAYLTIALPADPVLTVGVLGDQGSIVEVVGISPDKEYVDGKEVKYILQSVPAVALGFSRIGLSTSRRTASSHDWQKPSTAQRNQEDSPDSGEAAQIFQPRSQTFQQHFPWCAHAGQQAAIITCGEHHWVTGVQPLHYQEGIQLSTHGHGAPNTSEIRVKILKSAAEFATPAPLVVEIVKTQYRTVHLESVKSNGMSCCLTTAVSFSTTNTTRHKGCANVTDYKYRLDTSDLSQEIDHTITVHPAVRPTVDVEHLRQTPDKEGADGQVVLVTGDDEGSEEVQADGQPGALQLVLVIPREMNDKETFASREVEIDVMNNTYGLEAEGLTLGDEGDEANQKVMRVSHQFVNFLRRPYIQKTESPCMIFTKSKSKFKDYKPFPEGDNDGDVLVEDESAAGSPLENSWPEMMGSIVQHSPAEVPETDHGLEYTQVKDDNLTVKALVIADQRCGSEIVPRMQHLETRMKDGRGLESQVMIKFALNSMTGPTFSKVPEDEYYYYMMLYNGKDLFTVEDRRSLGSHVSVGELMGKTCTVSVLDSVEMLSRAVLEPYCDEVKMEDNFEAGSFALSMVARKEPEEETHMILCGEHHDQQESLEKSRNVPTRQFKAGVVFEENTDVRKAELASLLVAQEVARDILEGRGDDVAAATHVVDLVEQAELIDEEPGDDVERAVVNFPTYASHILQKAGRQAVVLQLEHGDTLVRELLHHRKVEDSNHLQPQPEPDNTTGVEQGLSHGQDLGALLHHQHLSYKGDGQEEEVLGYRHVNGSDTPWSGPGMLHHCHTDASFQHHGQHHIAGQLRAPLELQPEPDGVADVVEDLSHGQVHGALLQLQHLSYESVGQATHLQIDILEDECQGTATICMNTGLDMFTTHTGVIFTPFNRATVVHKSVRGPIQWSVSVSVMRSNRSRLASNTGLSKKFSMFMLTWLSSKMLKSCLPRLPLTARCSSYSVRISGLNITCRNIVYRQVAFSLKQTITSFYPEWGKHRDVSHQTRRHRVLQSHSLQCDQPHR